MVGVFGKVALVLNLLCLGGEGPIVFDCVTDIIFFMHRLNQFSVEIKEVARGDILPTFL